ncbi:MAG TPA: FKBP-type peptidyl-prolyl cis-trans isomerase [Phnomibacter sp.]|nr:FKBP-type peptidyl-prolyl cis-trans isomerase [Phnomibacter sp.]
MLLVSCGNAGYKVTPSGVKYSIFSKGSGKSIKPGDWIKVHFSAKIGDSSLISTYTHIPAYGQYDTTMKNTHDFIDFLGELKIGDSVVFLRSVDTLQKRGYLQYNDVFKAGGIINGAITILGIYPNQQAVMEDQQKETELEKQREVVALEQYLKDQKVEGLIKTKNGIFIKMEKQGDGPKVDTGSTVIVNYTGTLKNGSKFDSNLDSAFGHVEPLNFVVGAGGVIPGWDEAALYFNKGGKGKVYIPAMLGYGGNGSGDKIPPFSDLVFDMEVIDVKAPTVAPATAPPAPVNPHAGH